jgi:hypothetical protein
MQRTRERFRPRRIDDCPRKRLPRSETGQRFVTSGVSDKFGQSDCVILRESQIGQFARRHELGELRSAVSVEQTWKDVFPSRATFTLGT